MASELDVSTQQVISYLEELGKKVRGPSTVIGVSAAAKIRGRFRPGKSGGRAAVERPEPRRAELPDSERRAPVAVAPAGSLFLPPVAPVRAAGSEPPAAIPVQRVFANPFAVPADAPPRPRTPPNLTTVGAPPRAVGNRVPSDGHPVPDPAEPDVASIWRGRGFDADDQASWCAAGLRPGEAEIADRCRSAGIISSELKVKLSGRTALQRLRDGEASTSVWARIREAEQQPRRAGTKLTGRFQLS